jgi:glycosyltransferase involved in cell wall biosynthesis
MNTINKKLSVSIILPVYNQGDHIYHVVENFYQSFIQLPIQFELVLVLNGCNDNSLEECEKAAKDLNHITIHTNDIIGWGAAVIKGIEIAKYTNICYTNSANTTSENLIMVINKYFENPDSLVKINRTKRKSIRKSGSFLYNLEAKILFGIRINDINGTPKIFNKNLLQDVKLKSTGDLLDLELIAIMTRQIRI